MTPSEIRQWLEQTYSPAVRTRWLKASPHMDTVLALYPDTTDRGEAAYMFVNGMGQRPTCPHCKGPATWLQNRFSTFCSKRCASLANQNAAATHAKVAERKAIDPSYEQSRTERRHATLLSKYGKKVGPNHRSSKSATWEHLNSKGRETLKQKHGVDNPGQLPNHGQKMANTCLSKHGVTHVSQTVEARQKHLARVRNRIGAMLPAKVELQQVSMPDGERGEANLRYHLCCECGWRGVLPSETLKFRLRQRGDPCDRCSGISSARSLQEKEICDHIRTIFDGPISTNDRSVIRILNSKSNITRREIDIYLPSVGIGVEFCGLYWHSSSSTGSDEKFRHESKRVAAGDRGVRLVTIFEDEWVHHKNAVKNRLSGLLGVQQKYNARECTVREVSVQTARSFCDEYHVQGYAPSSHKLGLYHGDQMVALMTFARPSAAKGQRNPTSDQWEISRFCSLGAVRGGASKLFKHFVRTFDPRSVITYSDRRWGDGQVYLTMGFTRTGVTPLNYWYVSGNTRIHRYALRKNAADDATRSEFENRAAQGWRWIWDCGNVAYRWDRESSR